jgi:hypothetical protein
MLEKRRTTPPMARLTTTTCHIKEAGRAQQ